MYCDAMCCILWHYILSPVLCSFVLHFMLCIVLYCIVLSCPLLCQRCVKPSLTVFNWYVTRTLKWPGRSRVQIVCNTWGAYHVQHMGRLSRATHRALITCNTSGAYHVQHIGRLSRATRRVPRGTKGQLRLLHLAVCKLDLL